MIGTVITWSETGTKDETIQNVIYKDHYHEISQQGNILINIIGYNPYSCIVPFPKKLHLKDISHAGLCQILGSVTKLIIKTETYQGKMNSFRAKYFATDGKSGAQATFKIFEKGETPV